LSLESTRKTCWTRAVVSLPIFHDYPALPPQPRGPSFSSTLLSAQQEPAAPAAASSSPTTFEFEDGDKVVLIGSTVLERDQRYGWFEYQLSLALADKNVSVRNLAWSGDTVYGHARSYFGPPEEGLQRLSAHLDLLKPTVVVLCYGAEMAHQGLGGLPGYLTGVSFAARPCA